MWLHIISFIITIIEINVIFIYFYYTACFSVFIDYFQKCVIFPKKIHFYGKKNTKCWKYE